MAMVFKPGLIKPSIKEIGLKIKRREKAKFLTRMETPMMEIGSTASLTAKEYTRIPKDIPTMATGTIICSTDKVRKNGRKNFATPSIKILAIVAIIRNLIKVPVPPRLHPEET